MTPHRFVVLATRARGFDSLDEARRFALANYPCIVMERVRDADGASVLVKAQRGTAPRGGADHVIARCGLCG